METSDAERYLERIGATPAGPADAATLARLQRAHLMAVPFENLDIHLGVPIELAEASLLDKIVQRRRGGFCYELNGLFASLLGQLGYEVTLLAARVFGGDHLGPPFDHMALRVDLDEPWLVDVGFGRFSHEPLRLEARGDQVDPGGVFAIADADHGDLDVSQDGAPQYRLEQRPRELGDFEATCWWQQTSPKSHFRQGPVCSRLTEHGRVTLSDRLLIETAGDQRTEHTLKTDAEVLGAYRDRFGIELDRLPAAAG